MSDERYPILIERYRGDQSLLVACQSCDAEFKCKPEDLRNEATWFCPCGSWMTYKYAEADHKCPNCGKLGFFSHVLDHCCSRVCQLQAEYAKTLEASRA